MKRILAPKIVVYIWFTGSLFMTVEVAEVARSDYSNALVKQPCVHTRI